MGSARVINAPSVGLYIDVFRFLKNRYLISIFPRLTELKFCVVLRERFTDGTRWEGLSMYIPRFLPGNIRERIFLLRVEIIPICGGRHPIMVGCPTVPLFSLSGDCDAQYGYFMNRYTGKKADDLFAVSGRARLEWDLTERLSLSLMSSLDHTDQEDIPMLLMTV
jgi:hypothetical protein